MKFFLFRCIAPLAVFLQLASCDSGMSRQIEKCVEAGLAANGPYKNSTEKADTELGVRGFCMRSAAGKD